MASLVKVTRKTLGPGWKVLWTEDRIQHSMTFDKEPMAELLQRCLNAAGNVLADAERLAQHELASGPVFEDSIEYHLRSLTGIEERTRDDYRRECRLHITPELGMLRTAKISKRDIREWVNAAQDGGASPKSISNRHSLMSAIFATAIEDGVRLDNPCKGVRLPARDRRHDQDVFLEPEEYAVLLSFIPEYWRPLVETMAGTGARWSEVSALQVRDFSPLGQVPNVRVTKAWKKDGRGRPYLSTPKTENSYRTVTISGELREILSGLLPHRAGPEAWLFQKGAGGPVTYNYFHSNIWRPSVKRAVAAGALTRLPKIHDLRHSHGSWLIGEGVDLMAVQRRLGHENIDTTTKIYGHISARTERAAAEAIGRALSRV